MCHSWSMLGFCWLSFSKLASSCIASLIDDLYSACPWCLLLSSFYFPWFSGHKLLFLLSTLGISLIGCNCRVQKSLGWRYGFKSNFLPISLFLFLPISHICFVVNWLSLALYRFKISNCHFQITVSIFFFSSSSL